MIKEKRAIMLLVLMAFSLFAVKSSTITNNTVLAVTPRIGGTIVAGGVSEPPTLNPLINWETGSTWVIGKMFDTLVDNDMELNPIPRLAKSWEISADNLTYTFHLVENVTWHDGVKFTSADVNFSYSMFTQYQAWGEAAWGRNIDSITTPDNNTVIFHLKKPFDVFRYMFVIGWIIPKHILDGVDVFQSEFNVKPVGTGPFVFKEWVKGSHVIMDKNPNYWKAGQPYLDKVICKFYKDPTSLVLAFEKGEVDHIPQVGFPLSEVTKFMTYSKVTIEIANTGHAALDTFFFNCRKPPFDNVLARQAVAHCVNRTLMKQLALYGIADTDQQSVIARIPALEDFWNPDIVTYDYNITEANRLFDEAGYPMVGGTRFTVNYLTWGLEDYVYKEAEILKSALAECGVTLEIQQCPYGTWTDLTAKSPYPRAFNIAHLGYSTGPNPIFTCPSKFLSQYANSTVSYQNLAGYSNPEVDLLWNSSLENPSPPYADFKGILYILSQDVPAVSIAERVKVDIRWTDEFVGLKIHPWSSSSYDDVWSLLGDLPSTLPTGWDDLVAMVQNTNSRMPDLQTSISNLQAQLATTTYVVYGMVALIVVLVLVTVYFARKQRPPTSTHPLR